MNRRAFTLLLGGASLWPLGAQAQSSRAPRKVGILFPGVLGAERERLINEGLTSELGGEKAILLVRSANGDDRLLAKQANELVSNVDRSEEHTSELQPHLNLVCRLLLEKKKKQ